MLFGREPEREVLRRTFGEETGPIRHCVVQGPPGIGKSALVEAWVAERPPGTTGLGRAPELTGAPPFWPWIEALEQLGLDTEPLAQTRAGGAEARFRQFEAVRRTLERDPRPLLVVLDDAHVADVPSLLLARHLVRHGRRCRVGLLLTMRDAPAEAASADGAQLLAELSAGHSLLLRGLAADAVTALARSVAPRPLSATTLAAIAASTDGVPLLVRELALTADGRTDGPLPVGVRGAVRRQLHLLPPPTRDLVCAAALLGRRPLVDAVAALVGRSPPEVQAALEAATRAGLLTPGPDGRLAFTHALLCDALVTELPQPVQQDLHARAAALAGILDVSARARHALAAARLGPAHRRTAAGLLKDAADAAGARLAWEQAELGYRQAVEVGEALPVDARVRLHLDHARAAAIVGRPSELDAALRLVSGLDDPELLAEVALARAATREFMHTEMAHVALLEQALDRLGPDPRPVRVRVMGRLARDLGMDPGSRSRRDTLSARAVSLAEDLGDPALVLEALDARLHALYGPGNLTERAETGARIAALARAEGSLEMEAAGLAWEANARMEAGHPDQALPLARIHQSLAERLGVPGRRINAHSRRAALAFAMGEWSEGFAFALSARDIGNAAGDRGADLLHAAQLVLPAVHLDRRDLLEASEVTIGRAGGATFASRMLRALRGHALVALGRRVEAAEELRRLGAAGFGDLPEDFSQLGALWLLAVLAADLADRPAAAALLPRLAPYRGRHATLGTSIHLGPVRYATGRIAQLLGDPETARVDLAAAAEDCAATGLHPLLDHVRAARGPAPYAAAPPPPHRARLTRMGDHWEVVLGENVVRLRHQRGFEVLARVIRASPEEVHVLELDGRTAETDALAAEGADLLLDGRARARLKARLVELDEALAEAEADHDLGRHEAVLAEREAVLAFASRATGLGGRGRRSPRAAERARIAATVAILRALATLEKHLPELAAHLRLSVHTGTRLSYRPDPTSPVRVTS